MIAVRVLGRRIERNIHDVLRHDQLGLRSGKGTRNATGDAENIIRTNSDHR